ncbi:MAG: hypothetical protein WCK39_06615 [Methanomassiliicoccales archaeon]
MVVMTEMFDEIEYEIEDMLDVLSEAIDMIEEGKAEEGLEVLKALEEDMFDFLGYVEVDDEEGCGCGDAECEHTAEVVDDEPAAKKAPAKKVEAAKKPAPKPAAKPAPKKSGKK